METRLRALACLVTLTVSCGLVSAAAEPAPIPEQALAALSHFMHVDCETVEAGAAREALLQHAGLLLPELERNLVEGPDTTLLEQVRLGLEQSWARRQAFLATQPELGLSPEHLLRVETDSAESYVERRMGRFVQAYRERAVIGIAAIGSPEALALLRTISLDSTDPAAGAARSALREFAPDSRRPMARESGRTTRLK